MSSTSWRVAAIPEPLALSERERQVVAFARGHSGKLIAYELGLSQSTIALHLSQAMRKLGVRSRPELVALLARAALGARDLPAACDGSHPP